MKSSKRVAFLSVIVAIMICCNSISGDKKKARPLLAGNWISQTYIDSLDYHGTTSGAKNAKCLEIIVSLYVDSICLVEGDVNAKVFQTTAVADSSFTVIGFENDENTSFKLDPSGRKLVYADKQSGKRVEFRRIEPKYAALSLKGWLTAARLFLNERYFAAKYYSINDEGKISNEVAFTSYGEIIGLPAYKFFRICFNEACINASEYDLIYLSDEKGSDPYIYQWKNDTMHFYSIKDVSSHNAPEFVPFMEIFRFVKKMR